MSPGEQLLEVQGLASRSTLAVAVAGNRTGNTVLTHADSAAEDSFHICGEVAPPGSMCFLFHKFHDAKRRRIPQHTNGKRRPEAGCLQNEKDGLLEGMLQGACSRHTGQTLAVKCIPFSEDDGDHDPLVA